jgi:hypothetical protein
MEHIPLVSACFDENLTLVQPGIPFDDPLLGSMWRWSRAALADPTTVAVLIPVSTKMRDEYRILDALF